MCSMLHKSGCDSKHDPSCEHEDVDMTSKAHLPSYAAQLRCSMSQRAAQIRGQQLQRGSGCWHNTFGCDRMCCATVRLLAVCRMHVATGAATQNTGDRPVDYHEDRAPENGGDAARAAAGGPPLALPRPVGLSSLPSAQRHTAVTGNVRQADALMRATRLLLLAATAPVDGLRCLQSAASCRGCRRAVVPADLHDIGAEVQVVSMSKPGFADISADRSRIEHAVVFLQQCQVVSMV
jgi:hypothetical protein